MFCKHCGKQIKENAKFCGGCGKPTTANYPPSSAGPANSKSDPPAHPEPPRAKPDAVASPTEAPRKREAAHQPGSIAIPEMNNRKPLVVGIAIALIVGLAIGAVSFYLLRPAARSDGLMSTASTTVPPVTGTASASTTTAPPTTQDAAPNAALPPAFTCFDLSKQEPHSLEGKLRSTVFADEPDYADVRHGDDPVEGYLLQLDSNICIQGDESADPTIQIAEVQVYPKDWDLRIEAAMRSLIGFRVRLTLAGGQSAMTGHDHRPLVAQVSDIVLLDPNAAGTVIPRTMLPRTTWTDIASTTVLAFYEALSLGNGEVASSLVVAEKRSSGPYAPENINRFYGPLPEPLRLTELKAQGPNEYLARYTYGTSSRRCRGSSIVTTTQRDGLTFIDRIRELEGCAALSSSDHLSVANSNRPIPHGPNNGQDRVTRTIAPTPSATIASAHTNIRQDPQHPLKIGEDYYPDASKRANEEGRCVVKLTVAANGRIVDQSIQESSGFPRLDEACVSAVRGQRMLPATENGRPVETTVAIPIVWKLNN